MQFKFTLNKETLEFVERIAAEEGKTLFEYLDDYLTDAVIKQLEKEFPD